MYMWYVDGEKNISSQNDSVFNLVILRQLHLVNEG